MDVNNQTQISAPPQHEKQLSLLIVHAAETTLLILENEIKLHLCSPNSSVWNI